MLAAAAASTLFASPQATAGCHRVSGTWTLRLRPAASPGAGVLRRSASPFDSETETGLLEGRSRGVLLRGSQEGGSCLREIEREVESQIERREDPKKAAMARVLREARSGGPLIPAIFRRRAEEEVAALLPRLGSCPAASAGRLMHTGFGGSTKLQPEKALPFGRRVLSQGQKTVMRMERFSSRRTFMSGFRPGDMPWGPMAFGGGIGLALGFWINRKY